MMTKPEKLLKKLIKIEEEIIDNLMENLKPELREKVVWQFDDKIIMEGEGYVRARIHRALNPLLITFFSECIVERHIEDLKNIIGHEIGHLFAGSNEEMASRLEGKPNIFNDKV